LRAWALTQEQAAGIALWLIGDGEELARLNILCEELGIRSSVRFKGYRPQEELPGLYQNAELIIVPSRNEGHSRVILESGACGAICVATKVGGNVETVIDGVTGFLVEPESPPALAQALLRALNLSQPEKLKMSTAARSHIERNFNQAKMAADYERVFQSVLHGRNEKEIE
jgi:glycosyltransferase involved in cell wall biosynthesis